MAESHKPPLVRVPCSPSWRTNLSGGGGGHQPRTPLVSIHGLWDTQDTLRVKSGRSTRPLVIVKAIDNPVGLPHSSHTPSQFSELRHWAPGHSCPGDTELSVNETPTLPCVSQALLETVTGCPYFFHLSWQWRGCPMQTAPSPGGGGPWWWGSPVQAHVTRISGGGGGLQTEGAALRAELGNEGLERLF